MAHVRCPSPSSDELVNDEGLAIETAAEHHVVDRNVACHIGLGSRG